MRLFLVSVYALVTMGFVSCSNSDLDTSNVVDVKEHNEVVAKQKEEEEAKRKEEEEKRRKEEEERKRLEDEKASYPLMKYLLENFDNNSNGSLEESEIVTLERLNVSNKKLTDLVGIEKLVNLAVLDASNNRLTTIPKIFPPFINDLNISSNKLTSVDIRSFGKFFITGSTKFDATNNPDLKCIGVNSTQYNLATRTFRANWKKDDTATFSVECN